MRCATVIIPAQNVRGAAKLLLYTWVLFSMAACKVGPHHSPAGPLAAGQSPPTTVPTTAPAETAPATQPSSQTPRNTDSHKHVRHNFPALMAYRPIYVLAGPDVPNVKFQLSTKVPLLFPGGEDKPDPVLSNLYFGYTQTSLWDVDDLQASTIDTTFQPELFFAMQTPPPPVEIHGLRAAGLGLQIGVQHESNGRSGEESRNANYVYVQPTVFFGNRDGVHGEVAIKGRMFFGSMDSNEDLEDYYGHAEVFAAVRFGDGLHATVTGRLGDDPGRGALQIDLSYPLQKLRVDAYFHVQYFNGFTESLLDYDEHHQTVRVGVSFVR